MIPLVDLAAQYRSIRPEIDAAVRRVLESGHFILGEEVAALEKEIAAYLGVEHAIGVASGTDALILALRALGIGPGDEVLVPAYTFFATASAVLLVGADPIPVDVDRTTYCLDPALLEASLTSRTKAVIPVHLYGHPAPMKAILDFARRHGLKVIEDNAQALGAEYDGRRTGSLGDVGCLSFFPTKNLGAYGDGGMIVTNDPETAEQIARLRTHGWKRKYHPETLGYNSRLDAIQAAVLHAKLVHLETWNARRRELADTYRAALADASLDLPLDAPLCRHVYHLFVIRTPRRDALRNHLKEAGVASEVYYPAPVHLTRIMDDTRWREGDFPEAEIASRETLAVPLYPELSEGQIRHILQSIRDGAAG